MSGISEAEWIRSGRYIEARLRDHGGSISITQEMFNNTKGYLIVHILPDGKTDRVGWLEMNNA